MSHHIRMHAVLAGLLIALWALRWAGVAIPTAVVYLAVFACPLMMVMMLWMAFGRHEVEGTQTTRDEHPGLTWPYATVTSS
jgi:hypothetical protein